MSFPGLENSGDNQTVTVRVKRFTRNYIRTFPLNLKIRCGNSPDAVDKIIMGSTWAFVERGIHAIVYKRKTICNLGGHSKEFITIRVTNSHFYSHNRV